MGGKSSTRERILAAALERFAEKGFASTSTAEIAAAAEVAEKTLFAHFGTKRALFNATLSPAVLVLVEPRIFSGVLEAARSGTSLRQLLESLITDRLGVLRRHPKAVKLVLQELILMPELRERFAKTAREQVFPTVLGALAELQARGEVRSDLPLPVVLRTIVSTIAGYLLGRDLFGVGGRSRAVEKRDVAQLVDLLMRALQ